MSALLVRVRSLDLSRVAAAAVAALATASLASNASAFCRATTCRSDGDCTDPTPACKELHWERTCVGIATQQDGSKSMPIDQLRSVIDAAFATWEQASCGNGTPGIVVQDLGEVTCGDVEYNSKAGNTNVLVFRDADWPHPSTTQLALTTVTFNPSNGEIYNADIEVNSSDFNFTDVGALPQDTDLGLPKLNDLLAVLVHETGHFLGLAHTTDNQATMYATYSNTSWENATMFRTIEPDDIAGICSIYPPTTIDPATCNPIPRHGFAPDCKETQVVGCSVAPAPAGEAAHIAGLGLLGAAAALVIDRRARARRSTRRS